MALKLANTSFNTTPDQSVVAVDVYGTPPTTPTNTVKGLGSSATDSIVSIISGNGVESVANILNGISNAFIDKGKVSLSDVKSAVSKATGLPLSAMDYSNGGAAVNSVLNAFGYNVSGDKQAGDNVLRVLTGVSSSNIKISDVNSLTTLSKLITAVSGDATLFQVLNLSNTVNTIKAINSLLSAFQLPALTDKLISSFSDSDQAAIVTSLATDTTTICNIPYLNAAIDRVGATTMLNANSNLVGTFLANYSGDTTYSDYSALTTYQAINNLLNRLKPNWPYKAIDGRTDQVFDLEMFRNLSSFIGSCFKVQGDYLTPVTIVDTYQQSTFVDEALSCYPWLSFSATSDGSTTSITDSNTSKVSALSLATVPAV